MYNSLLISSVAAFLLYGSPLLGHEVTQGATKQQNAPVTSWIAFAATPSGRVFQSEVYPDEEQARRAARSECESRTARTCSATISVPHHFSVVAMRCVARNGTSVFFGASTEGKHYDYSLSKATNGGFSPQNCKEVFEY